MKNRLYQGGEMRGKRIVKHCCIGIVLTRFMRELNLTYRQVFELTGIPKSTMFGLCNGVLPENPDILLALEKCFSDLYKKKVSINDILFGKDEDRAEMLLQMEKLEKENKELSRQLCFFQIAERMNG